MRRLFWGCLLLVGCSMPEVTGAGAQVRVTERSNEALHGCRIVGTIRDAEGGGLRSFEQSRLTVETRLRNEAGRLGGNTIAVIDEQRGDDDEGALQFATGVAGLSTPNPVCSNCVQLTAHVLQCAGRAPAPVVDARPIPRPPADDCVRQPAPLPPPAAPAAPPMMPAPAVTVIIIPAPPVYMPQMAPPPPPAAPPPQRDDDFRR